MWGCLLSLQTNALDDIAGWPLGDGGLAEDLRKESLKLGAFHVLRHPAGIALVSLESFTAAHLAAGDRSLIEPRFLTASMQAEPPLHEHHHKTSSRTALPPILGSSPMVEGIPAFFAAGKYGIGLIIAMSIVFAISTIATYVLLSVYSTAGLQRIRLGAFERYGEVLSGAFIALVLCAGSSCIF
jgi:hypothetical protein